MEEKIINIIKTYFYNVDINLEDEQTLRIKRKNDTVNIIINNISEDDKNFYHLK